MKRLIIVLTIFLTLVGCNSKKPIITKEIKGVWISYLELAQLLDNSDENSFKLKVEEVYDNCKDLGINTVYVHASAFTDAYYQSDYYHPSPYIPQNNEGKINFDPYKIMVELAKKYDLRFEAWINPLRSQSVSQMNKLSNNSIIKEWFNDESKKDYYLVNVNNRYYLNPSYPEVQTLVENIVKELLVKYDVDGIHIDDYFYPEGIDDSFDEAIYQKEANGRTRKQFRLDSTNNLVKKIYQAVKKHNPMTTFSISPAGNMDYNENVVYADIKTWLSNEGYLDYVVPQIYWGFKHPTAPYQTKVEEWSALIKKDSIKLVVGIGAYRIQEDNTSEWQEEDILARQVTYVRNTKHYGGVIFFSYQSLFPLDKNTNTLLEKQIELLKEELNK